MQALIRGEFLATVPTKSGKGAMLSLLQETASCDLYVPNEVHVPQLKKLDPVEVEATIRPGYEGRGFQATVKALRTAVKA